MYDKVAHRLPVAFAIAIAIARACGTVAANAIAGWSSTPCRRIASTARAAISSVCGPTTAATAPSCHSLPAPRGIMSSSSSDGLQMDSTRTGERWPASCSAFVVQPDGATSPSHPDSCGANGVADNPTTRPPCLMTAAAAAAVASRIWWHSSIQRCLIVGRI